MFRCLSVVSFVCASALTLPASALENSELASPPLTAPSQQEDAEMGTPSSTHRDAQFMAWTDGRCVTLRYAVKSPGCVYFNKAVPQGINPRILLVEYSTTMIAGPMRIHVGQVTFTDYGYDSIQIPAFSADIHVLRCNDPPFYAQSMAYVQCGSIITQTLNPGNDVSCLKLECRHPLKYEKVIGHSNHCYCYDPCNPCCRCNCYSPCLAIREGAVCDDHVTHQVLIVDPTQRTTLKVPVLRP